MLKREISIRSQFGRDLIDLITTKSPFEDVEFILHGYEMISTIGEAQMEFARFCQIQQEMKNVQLSFVAPPPSLQSHPSSSAKQEKLNKTKQSITVLKLLLLHIYLSFI